MKPFEQATTEELRALWESQQPTQTQIVPAEPLTDPLEVDQLYYYPLGGTSSASMWDNDEVDHYRLKDKMVFPNSPEGRAGAELRAIVPHPGIHWQEDLRKLDLWWEEAKGFAPEESEAMHVEDFIDKYLTE